nr:transposase [Blautia sp.]
MSDSSSNTITKNQKSKSGYKSEVTVYECEDCIGSPQKEKCTKAKGNKRLYISKNFITRRQESYENILSLSSVYFYPHLLPKLA